MDIIKNNYINARISELIDKIQYETGVLDATTSKKLTLQAVKRIQQYCAEIEDWVAKSG
ncbi:MAG: hypothetical protein LBQ13_04705 [Endomicrobium sp.]|jgi:hypothetical protein|nr:hypothetical protein [Endomicrobium sp.]